MKILFAGTPENAAKTLTALLDSGHEISLVLTREDAPFGRKQLLKPSPVAVVAKGANVSLIKANKIDGSVLDLIRNSGCDVGVVVAFGQLFNKATLASLPKGWINLHYSLLPALRGAAPVQQALLQGMTETGISIFQLDEGLDSGPVFLQIPTKIEPNENAAELLERLSELGISGLKQLLPSIAAGLAKPAPQIGQPSFAPKPSREDARIDWRQNNVTIHHSVQAFNPEPMAWCVYKENSLRLLEASPTESKMDLTKFVLGQVFEESKEIKVLCGGNSVLRLIEVQPGGKKAMKSEDWFRGLAANRVLLE